MSFRNTYAAVASACVFAVCSLVSCSSDDVVAIPPVGEAFYEVDYSEGIRNQPSFGDFLPRTAVGVYDSLNVKISASAPLGFAKIFFVFNDVESFMAADLNDIKLMSHISSSYFYEDSLCHDVKFEQFAGTYDIAGIPSMRTSVKFRGAKGTIFKFDIFTAIGDSDEDLAFQEFTPDGNLFGRFSKPCLVTAVNARFGDENIILMLKSVRPVEQVKSGVFNVPDGYIEANVREVVTLYGLL